ncbi:hypothetical protein K505DRAFT_274122 [Melanomma pulvis-pyrius CBS 109.77]|uniref:Uncharacterized protein n=1 Tax=Melanomma pulvis-pyrius CBS 109.77 TaxID=1314802 RepID=A0A6A6XH37_9PLEO|nr:hypothetical protein K505DRAFT_274122 [Melanomma pulvis-pyrius CBS 109.77]
MTKIKRTPVPLPGQKPKSPDKPSRTPSKAPLSQEFIESSDDSANEETPRKKASQKPAKRQATTSIAVHRPKVNGVQKKAEKVAPKPVNAPKKIVKEVLETSSSSEESEDEDEGAKSKENIQQQNAGNKADADTSDSASDSDSSSDESDEPAPAPTQSVTPIQSRVSQSHAVDFRPAQAYIPPKDFTAISTPLHSSSPAVRLFENLEGKQIWHITAPANVSLASLKELAMDKALEGDAVLKHNSIDYGFSAGGKNEHATRSVLIPQQRGFKAVPTRITKTLHLQQVVRLANLPSAPSQPTNSEPPSFITSTAVRAPRPQVKGLKMNFFPSGFSASEPGIVGSSDSETEAPVRAGSGPSTSNGTHAPHKPEKRKHNDESRSAERAVSPTKKHKKHRTPEEIRRKEEKRAKKDKKKREKAKS